MKSSKPNLILLWIGWWIASWLDVICGLISVVTLCSYRPWWDLKFRAYWSIKLLSRMRKS